MPANPNIPFVSLTDTINDHRISLNKLIDSIGDISSLTTTADNIAGAMNELKLRIDLVDSTAGLDIDSAFASIGQLSDLDTTQKANLVAAVNEVWARVNTDSDFHTKFSVVSDSGGGILSYNNTNGQFTFTGATAANVREKLSVATGLLAGLTYDETTGEFNTKFATESDGVGVASFDSDVFNVSADGHVIISNGGITNGHLQYDDVTINGQTVSLGGSITLFNNTDNITEGSNNLYHTTTRARNSISASGDITYNASTGVMSYTGIRIYDVNGTQVFP